MNKSVLFALVMLPFVLSAQVTQPDRFEMDLTDAAADVISAEENGLFLILQRSNSATTTSWRIIQLDTLLNAQWQREYEVENSKVLSRKYYDNGILYFLYMNLNPKNRDLELITFDVKDGSATSRIIKNFIPLSVFDFKVSPEAAIIAGTFNFAPICILYDFNTSIPRVVPGLFEEDSEIAQVKIEEDGTFKLLIIGIDIEKRNTIKEYTYSNKGDLLRRVELETEKRKNLLYAQSHSLGYSSEIVAGIYGNRNSEYSKGIFLTNINEYGEQQTQFYSYGELSNFFNYMKQGREQRVRNRIARKQNKDKQAKFSYRMQIREIIKQDDQYILLGEAFYLKYKMYQGTYGMFAPLWSVNRGIDRSNLMFDGYFFTHAAVFGFNEAGELLWDNSFEITDLKTFNLKQQVHASVSDDEIALLYVFEDKIRSKTIRQDKVVDDKEMTPIELRYDSDTLVEGSTNIQGLDSWYDNVFFTYGTQQINNTQAVEVGLTRNVFFINKVIYK